MAAAWQYVRFDMACIAADVVGLQGAEAAIATTTHRKHGKRERGGHQLLILSNGLGQGTVILKGMVEGLGLGLRPDIAV